jgi:hypothetical protein
VLAPERPEGGSRLLLSRFEAPSDAAGRGAPALDFALLERTPGGWVGRGGGACRFPLGEGATAAAPPCSKSVADGLRKGLASAQTIVADVAGDESPDVVIVNEKDPSGSILLVGGFEDGAYALREEERFVCPVWVKCGPLEERPARSGLGEGG